MIRSAPAALGLAVALAALAPIAAADPAPPPAPESGVIRLRSANDVDGTVRKIKADVAAKGVRFFLETDQSELGAAAGVSLRRSVLVQFGNPPLGTQFLTATPYAGLDWPVRMLVFQDADGGVWIAWTDFGWIARRHHIEGRDPQLRMASEVAGSIAEAGSK